jgi:hypothetical protein
MRISAHGRIGANSGTRFHEIPKAGNKDNGNDLPLVRQIAQRGYFAAELRQDLRQWIDIDQRSKALKVGNVECQQAEYAAIQHCRDDIGVMDLTAVNAIRREDIEQVVEHAWPLFSHLKSGAETADIVDCRRHWQRRGSCLRPGYDGKILAQYLRADP